MVAKPSKEATEEIKERIRRILALTNNPNANEAAVAAEKAAQATAQSISSNLTNAANQGLVSNALGPVGTQ